jgi:chromosome segregation ATPase
VDESSVSPASGEATASVEGGFSDLASLDAETKTQVLAAELGQLHVLCQEQSNRIYHLEQALDQALICIDELQSRLQDQGILETQLITTEEFASIQQKAIARLKQQLEEQQHTLFLATQLPLEDHPQIPDLLQRIDLLGCAHHDDLDRLQTRITNARIEFLNHSQRLEQSLEEAQSQIGEQQRYILALDAEMLALRTRAMSLETQLDVSQKRIHELCSRLNRYSLTASTPEPSTETDGSTAPEGVSHAASRPMGHGGTSPQQELALAQIKVEELEVQLAKQMQLQAKWQQTYRELQGDRDRQQQRLDTLDRQAAEMQEQILQQAQQSKEYETAIQHWKDRYAGTRRQIEQLKDLLERVLPYPLDDPELGISLEPALAELLTAIQTALQTDDVTEEPPAIPSTHFNTLNVPDFLIRRRRYRSKNPDQDPENSSLD